MSRFPISSSILIVLILPWGCGTQTNDWATEGGAGGSGTGGTGGSSGGGGSGSHSDYCDSGGPPVEVEVGDEEVVIETCAGAVAERVFTYSVCSCTDVNLVGYLETRSFDSARDREVIEAGAPVGINGTYTTGGYTDLGGSFTVSGDQAVNFAGYLALGGDLRFGGNLSAIGYIEVGRDAWLDGNVTVPGYIWIGRDLYQTPGRRLTSIVTVEGERHPEAVSIAPPCACEPHQILDIGSVVDSAARDNDNALVGLDPAVLNDVAGIGVEIELPCGRFYLERIGGLGGITLRVTGHTALFVEGDVNSLGYLSVELAPEGELDLFIKGNLVAIGAGSFGSTERPAASRIYVGGEGDVVLVGAAEFVGNVYAPRSRITAVGAAFVYGSLFGRHIDMPGALMVNYDRHILNVGDDCGDEQEDPPAGSCDRCDNSCPGNRACVEGECLDCRTDADCCEPLVCWPDGSCGSLMF